MYGVLLDLTGGDVMELAIGIVRVISPTAIVDL